eukprot:CAMPEP_0194156264 /NCGR_PEP_ID=MMETSP0152-20130528/67658_1 /TAXON_ID=1049557 /ORGANISM="Thalassiothrix antarctica, Strain L6-D1" /LENGTH=119 /DNA_ID=CAMNT_0038863807 /DNA_START=59 /DNA_END=415 /DNA_ORIENTATION=+
MVKLASSWVILALSMCIRATSASDVTSNEICGIQTTEGSTKCAILSVLPFDQYAAKQRLPESANFVPFGHMASVLLAVKHFNARNSYVVPELGNEPYMKTCKVEMPLYCEGTSFIGAVR